MKRSRTSEHDAKRARRPADSPVAEAEVGEGIRFATEGEVTLESLGLSVDDLLPGTGREASNSGGSRDGGSSSHGTALDVTPRGSIDLSESGVVVAPPDEELSSFGPQPWEFTPRPRLEGSLAGLNDFFVLDELHGTVMIPSLFSHRKILLVFLRHFGCRFCRQQVHAIRECVQPVLRRNGCEVVLVALGVPAQIPAFREETGFDGEIYVDPLPDSPVAYRGFGLCGGKDRLIDDAGELLPHVQAKGALAAAAGFGDGGYGTGASPYTGDVFQVGGMFVLEHDACFYAHRSAYAGDVPDISVIVEASTGLRADGEPSTVVWPGWETECACTVPVQAIGAELLAPRLQRSKSPRVEPVRH